MTNEHSVLSAAQVDELLLDSQRLRTEVKRLGTVIKELHEHSKARERTYNLLTTTLDSYKAKVERL